MAAQLLNTPRIRVSQGLAACTGVLLAALAFVRLQSGAFGYDIPFADRPTELLVALMMLAGFAYFGILLLLRKQAPSRKTLAILLVFGALLRLMWLSSTPIYEDDFYRYFWDGAQVASGVNPYMHAPADARAVGLPADISLPPSAVKPENSRLAEIAKSGPQDRVAYPYIRTIYPPVAQAFFTFNHIVSPWGLDSWRMILFAVDCFSLWLAFRLLRSLNKPMWQAMIFWLNPLILTETMNAGHMDALLLPFLLGTALLAAHGKFGAAGISLAVAVGVKFWPIMLAPLLFRTLLKNPRKLMVAVLPFAVLTGLLLAPQMLAKLDQTAGIAAYAEGWQTNAFLFGIVDDISAGILSAPDITSRILVVALLGLIIFQQSRKPPNETNAMSGKFLLVTAALFLISPTGYPWYLVWLIPWLVVHPSAPLLLLTATLPLYDFRFPMTLDIASTAATTEWFHSLVVPLQFAPTLLWLAYGFLRKRAPRELVAT